MLLDQLKKASIQALKDRDVNARSVLSILLNKVKNAEIEKRSKGQELTDADVVSILQKAKKELEEERLAFQNAGRAETVEVLTYQIAYLEQYMPKMMSDDEIKAEIAKLDDKSIPNVMKHFKANFQGKCDMKQVQQVLKSM
ncbi:MAG: GatB/YqeY domain-containing protein [Clostridia bacterium]|nr:GatB/YqeY domain-containing protein [Clostridia bacterium]